jgi:hypothetical protein
MRWVQAHFPGIKQPGRGVNNPSPSSAEVKETVELYHCSLSVPTWLAIGRPIPLPLPYNVILPAERFEVLTATQSARRNVPEELNHRSSHSKYNFAWRASKLWPPSCLIHCDLPLFSSFRCIQVLLCFRLMDVTYVMKSPGVQRGPLPIWWPNLDFQLT